MPRFPLTYPTIPFLTIPAAVVVVIAIAFADPAESLPPTDHVEDMSAFSQGLDARLQLHLNRQEYKRDLVRRLADHEIPLADVTAEFLAMNREHPPAMRMIRIHYAGTTDEEKTAQNVFEYVQCMHLSASRERELLERLDHEYEALFGHRPVSRS